MIQILSPKEPHSVSKTLKTDSFCIDASAVDDGDFSAAETLHSLHGILKEQGIRLVFAEVMDDFKAEYLEQLMGLVEEGDIYPTLEDVVVAYRKGDNSHLP